MFGISPSLILGFVITIALSTAGGYWKGHHDASAAAELDAQIAVSNAIAAKSEKLTALYTQLEDAQNAHVKQIKAVTDDANAAHDAVASLQRQLDVARGKLRSQPQTASNQYAIALSDLFEQCTVEYQRLAEEADSHAADVMLLQSAWPK